MISQPMNGKEEREIAEIRARALRKFGMSAQIAHGHMVGSPDLAQCVGGFHKVNILWKHFWKNFLKITLHGNVRVCA